MQWLQNIDDLGGRNYLDAVSIHLYQGDKTQNQAFLSQAKALVGDKPVWVTEIGRPSPTVRGIPSHMGSRPSISEEDQDAYLKALAALARIFPQEIPALNKNDQAWHRCLDMEKLLSSIGASTVELVNLSQVPPPGSVPVTLYLAFVMLNPSAPTLNSMSWSCDVVPV